MTATPQPAPQPGWYADPELPGELRYWDGAAWGQQWKSSAAASAAGGRQPVPAGAGFGPLSRFIEAGIGLSVLLSLAHAGVYLWGRNVMQDAVSSGDLTRIHRFDDLDTITSAAGALVFLVTGVLWLVWQRRLAAMTLPGVLRREPGWHVGSWFIPIGSLWMVIQNIRDLLRRFADGDLLMLAGWWWTLMVSTQVLDRIGGSVASSSTTVDGFNAGLTVSIVADGGTVLAAILAVILLRRLTLGGLAASQQLQQEQYPV